MLNNNKKVMNNKNGNKILKNRELAFLKRELNAKSEDILKAIAAVVNNRNKIQ